MSDKTYIAIDLKSFYASVECVEKGLDPLTTCLVVADESRTDKTICLAATPALKSFGVPGRARLFEARQLVKQANARRLQNAPGHKFEGKSSDLTELNQNPALELDFIIAKPRMQYYMEYSTRVFNIYQKYVSPEDIHVYSVDEVMMDATPYLRGRTPREFAMLMIREVLAETGITATAGIGTNLYLCKIAMDIVAKHIPADKDGVRIAELDEQSYREQLWDHTPITDFWRVGKGTAKRLASIGLQTMGDVALCSEGAVSDFHNEKLLYKLFGKNAELLIDHAWGWEPCTIREIKNYRPDSNSLSSGQVLMRPYSFEEGKIIVREMTDALALDLAEKGLVTDQLVLTIGYDIENLSSASSNYTGETSIDFYGRILPKHAHGTANLGQHSNLSRLMTDRMLELYGNIVNPNLTIRRVTVDANHVLPETEVKRQEEENQQLDLFGAMDQAAPDKEKQEKEKRLQETLVSLRKKYGKNAVLKATSLDDAATGRERNAQIGGHKA